MVIAEHLAAGQNRLKHTILKEVLHADILRALHESDLGKSLVFQGGTALRLCYGNQRYSEDLDFVRSAPLEPTHFEHFKKTLKTSIAERYELDVRISDPKRSLNQRTTDTSIAVHRFTAMIAIEKPGFKNQKIHIEVADIPAYDAQPRMINNPYAEYGAGPVMLNVSSEKEILADKVIAVAGRDYIKARDIWDIKWLRDRGIELKHAWVRRKAADYHLVNDADPAPLISRLKERIRTLALPETHEKFVDEMRRFLAKEQSDIWLANTVTSLGLIKDVSDFLEGQLPKLTAPFLSTPQHADQPAREQEFKAWRERMARTENTQQKKEGPKPVDGR